MNINTNDSQNTLNPQGQLPQFFANKINES